MQNHLGPSIFPAVKVFIGIGGFFQGQFMRNDPRWFGATHMNKVAQIAVVGFYIRLTGAHKLPFLEELAEIEG
jgi:hypothetical protein